MTNNREEQIYKAADKATYQTPPQYSELVHKSRKAMCAYEVGFIDGCVWADSHPHWISVEEELPKENQYVIAYNGVFNEIHLCDFHDGIFEDFYGPFTDGKITHWMPIVPPRKEEKK